MNIHKIAPRRTAISGCLASIVLLVLPDVTGVVAQTATNYNATNMWGAGPSGVAVSGALDSANAHVLNGNVAAAVNAAQKKLLVGGTGSNLSISSIGSQTIISNNVVGNNNGSTALDGTQSSINSGSVSNQGSITGR